mmetsp:Transcript_14020/g.32646  ORF Transcript_14020/g.32646 Transcript_14020/m.32646 type:complete len:205 (+) Transcript_14020:507-1121(+)
MLTSCSVLRWRAIRQESHCPDTNTSTTKWHRACIVNLVRFLLAGLDHELKTAWIMGGGRSRVVAALRTWRSMVVVSSLPSRSPPLGNTASTPWSAKEQSCRVPAVTLLLHGSTSCLPRALVLEECEPQQESHVFQFWPGLPVPHCVEVPAILTGLPVPREYQHLAAFLVLTGIPVPQEYQCFAVSLQYAGPSFVAIFFVKKLIR